MIKKENGKYNVYSKDGKQKLGSHPTHAQALAQLRAIETHATKPKRTVQLGE